MADADKSLNVLAVIVKPLAPFVSIPSAFAPPPSK